MSKYMTIGAKFDQALVWFANAHELHPWHWL